VGLGPGSFTGLRVGLATAKALARSVNTAIVGVSSLAALAYGPARINPGATVLTTFDARRREIYGGAYRWTTEGLVTIIDDCALSPQDFMERVEAEVEGPLVLLGDGQSKYPVLRQWDNSNLTVVAPDLATPSAVGVAQLGRLAAQIDGPADLIALEPNYIRPSDAVLPDKPPGPMPPPPNQLDN
jgi:tRNA threonylcarbamoyladenosine biosynthesis protein TsaB